MSRENDRRTEHAWRQRDQQAATNQARAAGLQGGGGSSVPGFGAGTTGGQPIRVQIIGADPAFFNEVRRAMGFSPEGGKTSGVAGSMSSGVDLNNLSTQFQAVLTDQQAIAQASKQIASDLSLAVNMVMNYQATVARSMGTYVNDMANLRRQETDHVQSLVTILSSAATSLTNAARGGSLGQTAPAVGGGGGTRRPPVGAPGGGPVPGSPAPSPLNPTVPASPHGGGGHGGGYQRGGSQTTLGQLRNRITTSAIKRAGGPTSTGGRIIRAGQSSGAMGALRAVPVLGTLAETGELANDAATWVTNQRAANAPYQGIYGGQNFSVGGAVGQLGSMLSGNASTDTSGFGQRIAEEGYVLGQRFTGGMTGDMARQAFQGVSNLGQAGNQRQSSLDFIGDNYNKMGMGVAQSLQLVQTAAQNSNQSLSDLSSNLQQVTAAAAATGQSANVLRQNFTGNYQSSLQAGLGAGSNNVAQAITMSTAGTNRDFNNVSFQGLLGNPILMQQVASQGNMSLGQLESSVAQGNSTAFTGNLQKMMNQRMTGVMDQSVRSTISSAVNKAGGNATVAKSPGSQYDIALQLMQNRDWNVNSARQVLGTMGVSVQGMSDEQIAEYYVSTMTSGGIGAQGQAQQNQNRLQKLPGNVRGAAATGMGGSSEISNLIAQQGKGTPNVLDWASQIFGGDATEKNSKSLKSITSAYQGYESKYGASNPAIDASLKSLGTGSGTQLRVHTASGDQVVSMADAIKYYSDQISTGSAYVVGGAQNGKRLSEVTGVTVPGFVPGQNGQPNSGTSKAMPGVGESWAQYQKDNPGGTQTGNAASNGAQSVGTVTVAPSAQLMQMFNWSSTGGVDISGSTSAGLPPALSGGTH